MNLKDTLSAINNVPVAVKRIDNTNDSFYIKAFIITIINDSASMIGARKCVQSITDTGSKIIPSIFPASTPITMRNDLIYVYDPELARDLQYTYPIEDKHNKTDIKSGMFLKAYKAADYKKIMACTISHLRLWKLCADLKEPIMILEHDALLDKHFKYRYLEDGGFTGGAIGLNHPIGATRKAKVFHDKAIANGIPGCYECPAVDDLGAINVPQGLAGNSAYIIKPWAATMLIDKVKEIGLWPNDAVMCKQFFPWLQITLPFYTKLQGISSSTTL